MTQWTNPLLRPGGTGELIHNFREAGVYPKLQGGGRLTVIARPEDLNDERKLQLKEHSAAIRAYLFRQAWVSDRQFEWFSAAERKHPNMNWGLRTPLDETLLHLYEEYQDAPIGSAADEVAWRARIDAMLVEYITERKLPQ